MGVWVMVVVSWGVDIVGFGLDWIFFLLLCLRRFGEREREGLKWKLSLVECIFGSFSSLLLQVGWIVCGKRNDQDCGGDGCFLLYLKILNAGRTKLCAMANAI